MRWRPLNFHSIRTALLALQLALPLAAPGGQPAVQPPPNASSFTIFLKGVPVGSEQVAVTRVPDGWSIVSSGRLGPPLDVVARRVQVRYTADWKPVELTIDATVQGKVQALHTVVQAATATTDITIAGQQTTKTDAIDANAVLLPSPF